MEVNEIRTGLRLTRSNPVKLFSIDPSSLLFSTWDIPRYDVSRDGERFLFCVYKGVSDTDGDEVENQLGINIVLNWFEELKERVPD